MLNHTRGKLVKTSLESILVGLTAQLAEIDVDLQGSEARTTKLKATRRQVVAAIRALRGDNADRPAPKKAQVRAAIVELLSDNEGVIDANDLEALVAEKLAADSGCSAIGLALRMREVLASEEFAVVDGSVRRRVK